jgi:hypothetical protein
MKLIKRFVAIEICGEIIKYEGIEKLIEGSVTARIQ